MKLKPVYQISIDGEMIGYIKDKSEFEKKVYQKFNDNEEDNIAFADLKAETNYGFKLVQKNTSTNEEQVIEKLKENADITYFQYAIYANGKQKETVNSLEKANEIVNTLKKQEFEDEVDFGVSRVYTKNIEVKEEVQLASICDNLKIEINKDIKEEKEDKKLQSMEFILQLCL